MVFYFSGTGNTKWIAKQICDAVGEKLYFIPNELNGRMSYHLDDDERIGFCFPVHGWQPPHIVRDFIRKLMIDNAEDHYCYAVCSCGDTIGLTMDILNKELEKKNLHASSVFSVIMPESYVCLPGMFTDTPENEKRKIDEAGKLIGDILPAIIERKAGEEVLVKGKRPWLLSNVIGGFFNSFMITDRPFRVDPLKCVHCGQCERNCPTNNVVVKNGTPVWKHAGCTNCLACYHHCPVHAIDYGSITKKRGQYYFKNK
ncbi:MAG: EFR1 family ferrodoxin [Candidatus Limimorpha sp.]